MQNAVPFRTMRRVAPGRPGRNLVGVSHAALVAVMKDSTQINSQFSIGPQPDLDALTQLRDEGFQTVVNLRTEKEQETPGSMTAPAEHAIAAKLGLRYSHIPVSPEVLDARRVDEFRKRCAELPKPVYVHCQSGVRAGAFATMHVALQESWSGEKALSEAESRGWDCDSKEVKEFVSGYVDSHRQG